MTFLWPQLLWLLLAAPALVALYVLLQRRKRKGAVRYASLDLVQAAIGPGQRIRRHVPPALMLLALCALIVAVARPTAVITLPSEQRTIIMAMDVSLSMRAADVEPTRLAAAQAAAKAFVQDQPSDVRIGIVTFAGTATIVVGSVAVLLPDVVSPPPLTVALFVTLAGALADTSTVSVIAA